MRWVVELPAPSGGTAATVTVDADSWSSALKIARGGVTPKKFKCEFEGEGVVRVHDLDVRERFVVRPLKGIEKPAGDEPVTPAPQSPPAPAPEPVAAAAEKPAASVSPAAAAPATATAAAPATATPETPINGTSAASPSAPPAVEIAAAPTGGNGAAASTSNGASTHPDVSGSFTSISPLSEPLPVPRVLFERDQDPDPTNPLIYRERVFAVPPETTEAAAEQLARQAMAAVRRTLGSRGRGKYVMIAVFDHVFSSRPERQPLVVLRWKDWRGDPEVTFPSRSAPAASTAPVVIAPSVPAPAPSVPAPAATPAPSVPAPAVATEPAVAAPAPVVTPEPVAAPAPIAAPEPVAAPAAPSIPAPVAAPEPVAAVSVAPAAPESITPALSITEDAATVSIPAPATSVVPASIPAPAPSAPPPATVSPEPAAEAAASTSVDDEEDAHDDPAPSGEAPASVSGRSGRRKRKKGHSPQTVRAHVPPPAETSSLTAVPSEPVAEPVAAPSAPEPATPAVVAAPETPAAVTETSAAPVVVTAPVIESVAPAPVLSDPPPAMTSPPGPAATPKFPRGTRRRGNDLVSDLFDGLMDLTFMSDAKVTCEFIAKLMRDMFWVDASAVLLYDIDRDELVVAAVNGIDAAIGGRQKLPKTPRGKAILKSTNVVLEHGADPDGPIKGLPHGPTLLVPMLFHQRVFGLLELHRAPGDETFQSDEQDGLVYVASQLAEWLSLHARRAAFEEYADKP